MALIRDVIGRFLPGTPVTQRLGDVRGAFVGGTASLTLDQQRAQQANIKLTPLIEAQKGYWSEPDYNTTDEAKLQADAAKAPALVAAYIGSAYWFTSSTSFANPAAAFGRMFVGAHLPLDLVGGAGLGMMVSTVARRFLRD